MCKLIIFGGTTEGRRLAEFMDRCAIRTHVCVATEYGGKLLCAGENLSFSDKRMDEIQMEALIKAENPAAVVDATHPFAANVTENIKAACERAGTEYIRLLRGDAGIGAIGESDDSAGNTGNVQNCEENIKSDSVYVETVEDAIDYLENTEGKILLTTGSKDLPAFARIKDSDKRIVARILSTEESVKIAAACGFEGKNLICMQGPFSAEMNKAMINQYDCKYLVTKSSGSIGGFEGKLEAASECGITMIIIGRPLKEEGLDFNKCKAQLCKMFGIEPRQNITIAGIGMGSQDGFTGEVCNALKTADLVIGAGRIADAAAVFAPEAEIYHEYLSDKIAAYIEEHLEFENIVVVMSGDIGFYSGAKKLANALNGDKKTISFMPGISSVVYFMGRIGLSWDDAVIVSNHGIKSSLVPLVRDNEKVFSILGKADDIRNTARALVDYGLGDVMMYAGQKLSYDDEKIAIGKAAEFVDYESSPLSVVAIVNKRVSETALNPLESRTDSEFERAKVPMTKEEIRTISVAKLRIKENSICWDIGAGTGSVSVEMAVKASKGAVYAIEKKEDALELLEKNKKKFKVDNMIIVGGLAPEALVELPAPDNVFIGGSSGKMDEIIDIALSKNSKARVVINCIALESVAKAVDVAKKYGGADYEIITISVSRGNKVGQYTMMNGENPITVVSFTGM